LGRAVTRTRRWLAGHRVEFVYSSQYRLKVGSVPLDTQRGERILTFLLSEGLVAPKRLMQPRMASMKSLRLVHTDEYLEALRTSEPLIKVFGFEPDDRTYQRALEAHRTAVGGTLLATRRALERRRVVVNLGGGLHHARPDRGLGFCIFNDVAVAIAKARGDGFSEPILVIDLDLHDGNGTRAAFAEDETVHTFSIHNQNWDDDEAVESTAIELGDAVDDETYIDTIDRHLSPLLERFQPGLVYYLAGTDPAEGDPLGNWNISAKGMYRRDGRVYRSIRRTVGMVPIVVALAGGYGAHTWRYSARSLGRLTGGERIEPPSTGEITVVRYRRLTSFLEERQLTGEQPGDDDQLFTLTEEDIYGGGGIVAEKTRLLDHYSLHGLELLLESGGLLDQLRRLGFEHPTVRFDLENPAGETFRIFSRPDLRELLIELRLLIDKRSVSGFELMRIEWMLAQNPRRGFGERRAMPGQTHPGLGLLRDVMAILVVLCERRELDGILFVPSHYHLAAMGKRYLRFADPVDEAWVRAVDRAVDGLSFFQATVAVAAGRLTDRGTGEPVTWRPMQMVMPLSDGLREALHSVDYEIKVIRELKRLDLVLAPEQS
jgi:acetoin utilization deacetylase AcuC-like enzyme